LPERIELLVVEKKRPGGIGLAIGLSFVLHAAFIVWFVRSYQPVAPTPKAVPIARYVEFLKQNPREFTEAPGPKRDETPLNAPLSDANRKASAPFPPNGDQPTKRPGDGSGTFNPGSNPLPRGAAAQIAPPPTPQMATPSQTPEPPAPQEDANGRLVYREQTSNAKAAAPVDWRTVVRDVQEVGKVAALGGGDGLDLGRLTGGEKGTFEQGPLSFESQWYDWGEYAQQMVSKIRVNWYANMPPLIRTGMQGVVTIRFTIQRDGRITDITILDSSTVPPYDFAARKAIDLSSPLAPLPKDFPNASERVTAMFFYNKPVPER
jgi:TonB family protein